LIKCRCSRLEQPRLGKRKMPAHAHDDVIEHRDFQATEGVLERLGDLAVGGAWRGDTRGMIVRQDDACRIAGQGTTGHFAGVDRRLTEGAQEELLQLKQPVAAVEKQDAKDLARLMRHAQADAGGHCLGAVEQVTLGERLAQAAVSQLECGRHHLLGAIGRAGAAPAELGQTLQPTHLMQDALGPLAQTKTGRPGAAMQQHGEQIGIGLRGAGRLTMHGLRERVMNSAEQQQQQREQPQNAAPQVGPGAHLTLHYRISLSGAGADVISTFGDRPATLTLGHGQLADSLEQRLLGLKEGDRQVFELAPGEAYGERNPELIQRVSRSLLEAQGEPGALYAPGDLLDFAAPNGGRYAGIVRESDATGVVVDFNHPLAGQALQFEVHLLGVL